jgi:hypothetical protein
VAKQLNKHIYDNNLTIHLQSAYKTGHSTETTLLKIENDIHLNMACGKATVLILLGLSAAFNTIDHRCLLLLLKKLFAIQSTALAWFKDYLENRTQQVRVNDCVSSEKLD